jgi:NitT/TauT family transport system ATP-binding protein
MMTLEVKNVYKKFTSEKKEFKALENINLSVDEGEFLAILGPSGCGKTTLLRMMAGLEIPTEGVITENGEPVEGPSINRGFVFQQYSLFPWRTVLDNVAFGPEVRGIEKEERHQMAKDYIELVGLSSFQDSYPNELSGGMKQRVAIARALVNDPKTLLMDEPFGALDVQTRHKLQEELVEIWEKELKTIVFVTHNVDEAIFLADRVVVLSSSPGYIINTFEIDLKRIRERDTPEYLKVKSKISNLLEY